MLLCELWGKCRELFWQNSLINRIAGMAYDVTQHLYLLPELLTLAYRTGTVPVGLDMRLRVTVFRYHY